MAMAMLYTCTILSQFPRSRACVNGAWIRHLYSVASHHPHVQTMKNILMLFDLQFLKRTLNGWDDIRTTGDGNGGRRVAPTMSSKGMGAVPRADPLQLFKIIPHFVLWFLFSSIYLSLDLRRCCYSPERRRMMSFESMTKLLFAKYPTPSSFLLHIQAPWVTNRTHNLSSIKKNRTAVNKIKCTFSFTI